MWKKTKENVHIKQSVLKAFCPLKASKRKFVPFSMEKEHGAVKRAQSYPSGIIVPEKRRLAHDLTRWKLEETVFLCLRFYLLM